MWAVGDVVQDRKTGKNGEIVRVTGPAPFIYRLRVEEDDGAAILIYRYGDQVRRVPPQAGGDPCCLCALRPT
ncbi:hypothetical protein [Streptomyces spirodelae]|uniref:DUF1918 domain-containing protein n=1 Tax=Streptomyces spirodelae TaxID=2812904 RepID=A0ABS3WNP2_9ACTN|nr:hypothetical protein [Streptomyces spirodelae]MBO8184644.1 hypothetical protein [Streptomyces spirodelae]